MLLTSGRPPGAQLLQQFLLMKIQIHFRCFLCVSWRILLGVLIPLPLDLFFVVLVRGRQLKLVETRHPVLVSNGKKNHHAVKEGELGQMTLVED